MPSGLKIILLRLLGNDIGKDCYIGFSYIDVDNIIMANSCYIGTGNIIKSLCSLEMRYGSRINRWNQITSNKKFNAKLLLGNNSSISLRHYFDVCANVSIGNNTIIAGHRSSFFTHSKGVYEIDYQKEIVIGEFCYIGSNVMLAPGSKVGHRCFVGMGSVVVGDNTHISNSLIAGNPAVCKKEYDENAVYFNQPEIIQLHRKR